MLYRGGYILMSILVIAALRKTSKVRRYDRLILGWLSVHRFLSPAVQFHTSGKFRESLAFDVIVPFAIYVFSPLQDFYNIALALGFSAGTLYIDHFYKLGIDPLL